MAVDYLVSLLCDEEISTESRLSSSRRLYMLPCPEPGTPGVGATKENVHKAESPTELVGQSLSHKQLEVLSILSH